MKELFNKFHIFIELWKYILVRKKWWLAPIIIVMLIFSILIVITEGSAITPFIYALF